MTRPSMSVGGDVSPGPTDLEQRRLCGKRSYFPMFLSGRSSRGRLTEITPRIARIDIHEDAPYGGANPGQMRVAFGECVFDSDTRELQRGGKAVHLSPKAFQLLETLLQARPKALSKPELHDRLWPKTHVSGSSLGRLVAEIRKGLGDTAAQPSLVRTLHGFGYAFCGTVTELSGAASQERPAGAVYRLVWGAREIELAPGINVVGREPGCAVWIDAAGVSRRHARILVSEAGAILEDLGSKNGTYLRGRKLQAPTPLADGDPIALGSALITIRVLRQGGSTDTVPAP